MKQKKKLKSREMKNSILTLIFLLISPLLFAQEDAITRYLSKYEDDENFTHVTVTSRMFGLFANLDSEDQEDQELLEAISKVKGLRIIARDEITTAEADALYKEAFELIPTKEYDELMTVKDKDNDMQFLIKEENGVITELLMVIHGNTEFFLLSLIGDIDLKQISRLSQSMAIDGFEHLDKIDNKK
jgi:hypothetical protein